MKEKKITPMLKQFLSVKDKHPDKIVLFRMGDFYETFFDDAKITSKVLGITLTSRNKKNDDSIPLAGFPYHSLDNYLDKLVKNGLKVVICEQLEDPKFAKGIVKRDIVDIITPGSIVDKELINGDQNNYLSAVLIYKKKNKCGLANIDISTGEFNFTEIDLQKLSEELDRLQPAEIVTINNDVAEFFKENKIKNNAVITVVNDYSFSIGDYKNILKEQFGTFSIEGIGAKQKPFGAIAAALALNYVKSLKKCELKHVNSLRYYSLDNYMQLDESSRRNLELFKSLRSNRREGSFIQAVDETKTPMGARLLSNWISYPLVNALEIEKRSGIVEAFYEHSDLLNDLRKLLSEVGDLSRLLSKAGSMRINPREIISLCTYLETAPKIKRILLDFDDERIFPFSEKIINYDRIITFIRKAVQINPPTIITDGNIINDGFNDELDELRSISKDGKTWIARLENEEKKNTGIPSLKIGYNKVFGYFIDITKTHKDKVPEHYIRKQTLVNSERYISPKLKEYESRVLGAEDRIKSIEYELFIKIREFLFQEIDQIQKYIRIIAELDVFCCFSFIAYKRNYVRPTFNEVGDLKIENGRHPVIEVISNNEEFIPNDVFLNDFDCRIALITGPNMAGKSTYLRQIGLIAIMAQIGSFVPASNVSLPVFDKVFTRVGASDNLAMGQSTFLVEMLETANILNSATPNSLVLLDEIGRGTSTFDGLSLAWAIVEYIHNNSKLNCKTLFATHYHELTELENILMGVKNFNISVREYNDEMIFLRKIERGGADQSYGIQVARLAGIPKKVILRAKQVLRNLENQELSPQGLLNTNKKDLNLNEPAQIDIFDFMFQQGEENNEILNEIKNLNINELTPLEAMQLINEWKKKI